MKEMEAEKEALEGKLDETQAELTSARNVFDTLKLAINERDKCNTANYTRILELNGEVETLRKELAQEKSKN